MIVARWQIDARFGHKAEVITSMRRWLEEIGSQVGWKPDNTRLLTGSVGVAESTVITEVEFNSLADLSKAWDRLATIDAHKQWSKNLEPSIVSGSHRWEILRKV